MIYKSLNDAAYSIIRDKIMKGEFALGSRIREDLLAEEISMSRTPVREAINRLVAEGLISKKSQRGLYLIDPEPGEIEDGIDIRVSLEMLSVEKCIERATDEDIQEMMQSTADFSHALERKDFEACNDLDGEFHLLIARKSGNNRLFSLLEELSVFFRLVRQKQKKTHPREKNVRTLKEHRLIIDAVRSRDIPAAREAVAANIMTMKANLTPGERDRNQPGEIE